MRCAYATGSVRRLMATSMRQLHSRQAATNAQCLSQYDWMNNAKNQTPCLIASWSVVPCQENSWIIPPLSTAPGGLPFYLGPRRQSALFQCQCNTVHYSLIAACGACQGFHGAEGIENWSSFIVNCPSNTIQGAVYPLDVPPETAFPPWAYLDLKVCTSCLCQVFTGWVVMNIRTTNGMRQQLPLVLSRVRYKSS
ncbi:hypothetical protein C8Q76DRAFT_425879 [Earliella scabrosa]|nr:hypothetical protein C8Q76DRAFT_425879 [Earliella scabrosa]